MSLTTHVLDNCNGRLAAGMKIELWSLEPRQLVQKCHDQLRWSNGSASPFA